VYYINFRITSGPSIPSYQPSMLRRWICDSRTCGHGMVVHAAAPCGGATEHRSGCMDGIEGVGVLMCVTSRVQESFRLTPPARVSSNRCKASASLALLAEAEGRDRGSGDVDRPAQRRDVGTQPQPPPIPALPFPVGWVGRIGKAQLRPTRRESCERAARRLSLAAGPRLSGGAASRT
jgi:hypothetical protein